MRSAPRIGSPVPAARGRERRVAARAPASANLGALQAIADASAPVQRLRQLSAAVIQRAADVFSTAHFGNPVAYLQDGGGTGVVEDGGSAGMSSEFYREQARRLAEPGARAQQIDDWTAEIDRIWAGGEPTKPEQNRSAAITEVVKALEAVEDWESAALFVRENSLRMSKGGIDLQAVRNVGVPGGATHTFHRDAGFVKASEAGLATKGDKGKNMAKALNGPDDKGWVQGHSAIDNYKHRFIEHVHVDKGKGDAAFEIYNGTKADGEKAAAWGRGKAALLSPGGLDAAAVEAANVARRDADLAAADTAEQQRQAAQ